MKIYSHRGNLNGPSEWENHPSQIREALQENFYVEVDVHGKDGDLFLGHDEPLYIINKDFIQQHKYQMIFHAKNFEALRYLRTRDVHHFFHDQDDYTLTSWGWIWSQPSSELGYDSLTIMAVPERANLFDMEFLPGIGGVCTDYPHNWRKKKVEASNYDILPTDVEP